jgi:hypothetical protein
MGFFQSFGDAIKKARTSKPVNIDRSMLMGMKKSGGHHIGNLKKIMNNERIGKKN